MEESVEESSVKESSVEESSVEESSVKESSREESSVEESTGVKYSRKRPQKLKIIARNTAGNTAGQVGVFLHVFFVLHSLVGSIRRIRHKRKPCQVFDPFNTSYKALFKNFLPTSLVRFSKLYVVFGPFNTSSKGEASFTYCERNALACNFSHRLF